MTRKSYVTPWNEKGRQSNNIGVLNRVMVHQHLQLRLIVFTNTDIRINIYSYRTTFNMFWLRCILKTYSKGNCKYWHYMNRFLNMNVSYVLGISNRRCDDRDMHESNVIEVELWFIHLTWTSLNLSTVIDARILIVRMFA